MDLCDLYNVSEETLVEMWVAFVVEKNSGMEPTLAMLNQMERTVLKTDKSIPSFEARSEASASIVQSPRVNVQYAYPLFTV